MQSLYRNGLELIYDAMYQTFIDYGEEFRFYNEILQRYNLDSMVELGSGTGNLAKHFIKQNTDYLGVDLSEDMVRLAKKKNARDCFVQGDIINFKLQHAVDAALITGRTTSYLTENKILNKALQNIDQNLNAEGYLIFDFIDALRFFKEIKKNSYVEHTCTYENTTYKRESVYSVNLEDENLIFNWKSKYFEMLNHEKKLIAKDDSNVRAFTIEEWLIFLTLNNFEILECIDRHSYAFDTYVIVARKTSS